MKTIYILGPLTTSPDGNENAFKAQQEYLKGYNLDVTHLHQVCEAENWLLVNQKRVLRCANNLLLMADFIVTLDGWESCPLAKKQIQLALLLDVQFKPTTVINHKLFNNQEII
jgi:hypothetical protein